MLSQFILGEIMLLAIDLWERKVILFLLFLNFGKKFQALKFKIVCHFIINLTFKQAINVLDQNCKTIVKLTHNKQVLIKLVLIYFILIIFFQKVAFFCLIEININ